MKSRVWRQMENGTTEVSWKSVRNAVEGNTRDSSANNPKTLGIQNWISHMERICLYFLNSLRAEALEKSIAASAQEYIEGKS